MPLALAMLRVLTDGDVHPVVVNHRGGNQVVAGAGTAENPLRRLGIAIEFPQQFAATVFAPIGFEGVQPTVAAGEQHLPLAAERGDRGR